MSEREQIIEEVRQQMMQSQASHFEHEKEKKRKNYHQQNAFVRKGQTLFTGSSLMEQFPISEYCATEGYPTAYNRGIGGYTTDEFLKAIDDVLLDLAPSKLFINIGTNDIRPMPEGEDWFEHLSENYRKICTIIRDRLPDTVVYMMAYYPVNGNAPGAKENPGMQVRTNGNIARANRMVASLAEEFCFHYIDVNDGLKDEAGNLQIEHTEDGIHFDAAAYRTVFEKLKPYL